SSSPASSSSPSSLWPAAVNPTDKSIQKPGDLMANESSIYEIHDERFLHLIVQSAGLEEIHGGCRWAEGPVWFADLGCLIWSDIPNERMLRWSPGGDVSVFRSPSNFVNGNTRDRQGRLVSCEHGG